MNILRAKVLDVLHLRGLTWKDWGAAVGKSEATMRKQMETDANPTVETWMEALRPLHASVEVLTEEELADFNTLPVLKDRIEQLTLECQRKSDEIVRLTLHSEELAKEVNKLTEINDEQRTMIKEKDAYIRHKDEIIERKDAALNNLLLKK